MIKQILHKYLHPLHHWRLNKFNELNELYVVMFVRGFSLSMMGLFIPVFMYKSGFGLQAILLLEICYCTTRVFADYASAFIVARFGPKHVLFVGQLMFLATSLLFFSLNTAHWPLWFIGVVWGTSQSMFFTAFDVDFSKIKHADHSGKEMGFTTIMSELGAFLGPIIGGLIGYFLNPSYIFGLSAVAMTVGLLPLFKTREPVHTHQKLDYASFKIRPVVKLMPAVFALHVENSLSIMLWPLFMAIFILSSDTAYFDLGVIASVAMIISLLTSYQVGKLADGKHGRSVLRGSSIINALINFSRPLISSYPVALGSNIVTNVVDSGFKIPFYKGYYDQIDSYPGHRIVFVSIMESLSSIAKLAVYCLLFVVVSFISERATLNLAFIIAGFASLLMMSEKFKTYDNHTAKLDKKDNTNIKIMGKAK